MRQLDLTDVLAHAGYVASGADDTSPRAQNKKIERPLHPDKRSCEAAGARAETFRCACNAWRESHISK